MLSQPPPDHSGPLEDSVTVLIAAHNASPFLHRAVESALAQTVPPLEILIVDDGSTDDTADVARRLGLASPSVRLLVLARNGGPAKARNAGLDTARGEWIAILDADDAFLPDRLERLTRIGNSMNADVVADNFMRRATTDETSGPPGLVVSSSVELIDRHKFVAQARPFSNEADWGLLKPLLRRSFLQEHCLRYPEFTRHGEDFLLIIGIFLAGGRYALSRTPGYLYTARSSGMSRTRIDYETMASHTATLLDDPSVCSDARMKRLLRQRVSAVLRLSAERNFLVDVRDHNFLRLARLMLTNYRYPRAAGKLGMRRAWRWLHELKQT